MADVLAVAEVRDGRVRGVSNEVVTAARALATGLGGEVHALVIGGSGAGADAGALGAFGAQVVKTAEHDGFATPTGETLAAAIAAVADAGNYGAVVFAATGQGKDVAPRVAAHLDVPLAADVTAVSADGGTVTAVRPVYAGKAFAHVRFAASPAVVSIRPNAFQPSESPAGGAVEALALEPTAGRVERVGFEASGSDAVDVGEATTIVSGGRGMKDPENWTLLEGLRDALGDGTGMGASRAVVDAGWRPHSEQVGQTGKTVSPNLYFAIGISGAIQHLAGMRTAGTIVAVNKDADAPIFQVADYGIVGDLFDVVPALTEAVRELKAQG